MSRCDYNPELRLMSIHNAVTYTEARRRCRMWNRLFLFSLMATMVVALWATFNHI